MKKYLINIKLQYVKLMWNTYNGIRCITYYSHSAFPIKNVAAVIKFLIYNYTARTDLSRANLIWKSNRVTSIYSRTLIYLLPVKESLSLSFSSYFVICMAGDKKRTPFRVSEERIHCPVR